MDDLVEQFINFTGAEPGTAEVFIKGNNRMLESAVNAYFDDPDPTRYNTAVNWTEDSWTEDRQGGLQVRNGEERAFNLHDHDENTQLIPLGAPSRPPTRNSQRGNGGTYLDTGQWVRQNQAGFGYEGEQAAIHQSLQGQEIGVVDTSDQEYVPDPEPIKRRRLENTPAFMKPLPQLDLLPGLITILHSIPQCREALLARHRVLSDYGLNPHWWEGDTIGAPAITLSGLSPHSEEATADSSAELDEVIHECQRLMGFLDETDRSYGSVQSLSQLQAIRKWRSSGGPYSSLSECFMAAWEAAVEEDDISGIKGRPFESKITSAAANTRDIYSTRRLFISPTCAPSHVDGDLYGALDNLLWNASPTQDWEADNWFETVAPVLNIAIGSQHRSTPPQRFQIPTIFYADRYMIQKSQTVREMRRRIHNCRMMIEDYDKELAKLQTFQIGGKRDGDASAMFRVVLNYIQEREAAEQAKSTPASNLPAISRLRKKLETINQLTASRVASIVKEKAHAEREILKLSRLFTEPSEVEQFHPVKRYYLRGVTVQRHPAAQDTYVLYAEDHEEMLIELDDSKPPQNWFRISYETMGTVSVRCEIVSEEAVISAARSAHSEVSLIYADEEMILMDGVGSLPQPLIDFVRADNNAFRASLDTMHIIDTVEDRENDSAFASGTTSLEDEPMASAEPVEIHTRQLQSPSADMPDPTGVVSNDLNSKAVEMQEVQRKPGQTFFQQGMMASEKQETQDEVMSG